LLAGLYFRRFRFANKRDQPDGREIANHIGRVCGHRRVDILPGSNLAAHHDAGDRGLDCGFGINSSGLFEGGDLFVGLAQYPQSIPDSFERRLGGSHVILCGDERGLRLFVIAQWDRLVLGEGSISSLVDLRE
jgi:hypothetical protein